MKIYSATWTTKNRKSDRGAQVKQNVLYFLFLTTFPSFCHLVKVTERVEDLQSAEAPFSKGILCFHNGGTAQKTSLEQIHKHLGIRILFHSKFYPQDLLLCLKPKKYSLNIDWMDTWMRDIHEIKEPSSKQLPELIRNRHFQLLSVWSAKTWNKTLFPTPEGQTKFGKQREHNNQRWELSLCI